MDNYPNIASQFRFRVTLLILVWTVLSQTGFAQETITFPARSSDLAMDSFWAVSEFGEGCCVLDLNVLRWDGAAWRGGKDGNANSDDYTWNVPIYAPANGVVASCWRNFPNNPAQGKDNRHPDFPDKILGGGNHVIIVTDEGNLIEHMHLKQGSTPASLCPKNADATIYPSTLSKAGGVWAVAAYIDPADRPRVVEGQYIGRAGNSGRSTGPHLHMNIRHVTGIATGTDAKDRETTSTSFPLPIRHAWAHRYDRASNHTPNGWFRLWGQGFSEAGNPSFKMLHASPYLRRIDSSAGSIGSDIDTVFLTPSRLVTATIDSSSTMKLISWKRNGIESIEREHETTAIGVADMSMVALGSDRILVAVKRSNGALKMISYQQFPANSHRNVNSCDTFLWTSAAATDGGQFYRL